VHIYIPNTLIRNLHICENIAAKFYRHICEKRKTRVVIMHILKYVGGNTNTLVGGNANMVVGGNAYMVVGGNANMVGSNANMIGGNANMVGGDANMHERCMRYTCKNIGRKTYRSYWQTDRSQI